MATPSRLRAAMHRLEARRAEIERQIIEELEAKFFATPSAPVRDIVTSGVAGRDANFTLGRTESCTAPNSHVTVTWFEA